jgi:hypothetical protein
MGVVAGMPWHLPHMEGYRMYYDRPMNKIGGIFRSQSYGIEYRTPGTGWTADHRSRLLMFSVAEQMARYLINTAPEILRHTFRAMPWLEIKRFMQAPTAEKREKILKIAEGLEVQPCKGYKVDLPPSYRQAIPVHVAPTIDPYGEAQLAKKNAKVSLENYLKEDIAVEQVWAAPPRRRVRRAR